MTASDADAVRAPSLATKTSACRPRASLDPSSRKGGDVHRTRLVSGDEHDPTACIEVEIGQQGTVRAAPETLPLDSLGSGRIDAYLAQQIAKAHGGSVEVLATTTMPRALLRIPR